MISEFLISSPLATIKNDDLRKMKGQHKIKYRILGWKKLTISSLPWFSFWSGHLVNHPLQVLIFIHHLFFPVEYKNFPWQIGSIKNVSPSPNPGDTFLSQNSENDNFYNDLSLISQSFLSLITVSNRDIIPFLSYKAVLLKLGSLARPRSLDVM